MVAPRRRRQGRLDGWLAAAVAVLLLAGTTMAVSRHDRATAVGYGKPLGATVLARGIAEAPVDEPVVAGTLPTDNPAERPGGPIPAGTPTPATPTSPPVSPTTPPPTTPPPTTPPPTTPPPTAAPQSATRSVTTTNHVPFATVGGIDLRHPAMHVEAIGLHQSNHEGARDLQVYDTAASPMVLPSRERLAGLQSAADVVVDPAGPLVAPVSGTVVRAGVYTLYCDITDEFLVIVPEARPGWEVKMLHVVGLQVVAGQQVLAGVTPIAERAHVLPFASQVDEWTAEPSWPHTHIEVVDTAIPNQPNGGSGYEDCG